MSTSPAGNCSSSCNCSPSRRVFLQTAAAAALYTALPAMAGPFTAADFDKLVPADKKLSPEWVKSLFDRGTPAIYSGDDLKYIGMPVGGLCAGQLYLSGDGRLWHWDIFNAHARTGSAHYAQPLPAESPVKQGFALRFPDGTFRTLDSTGFPAVSFLGQYPIATVQYTDPACPLAVTLEAFSPFIPLNTDDSSLPATILHFTLRNISANPVEATLVGSLENAVCLNHRDAHALRVNRRVNAVAYTFLESSVRKSDAPEPPARPDIPFEDWNRQTYEGWTVEGTAFGSGPIPKSKIPSYQGDVGGDTDRVVNSHASAPGDGVGGRDNALGKLTSRPFTIQRSYVRLWIGGGNHKGKTCVNLVVGGKVVASVVGPNNNKMVPWAIDARPFQGKQGVLEIVDAQQGSWGNIGVGRIWFSDHTALNIPLEKLPDNGTMGLALLGPAPQHITADTAVPLSRTLVGEIGRSITLDPGAQTQVSFVLAWHFPNLTMAGEPVKNRNPQDSYAMSGRYYATKFSSASAVADYIAQNFDRLASQTRLFRDTWYDSSLPFWFLDRTLLNASILASNTCYRFASGRFYGWEGVGCCPGTCTHVWHYAHSAARLFPDLERILRERVDFGLAIADNGAIRYRGEFQGIAAKNSAAVDGQAGSILRAYREHQMSPDSAFLKHNWPKIKLALQYLIDEDADNDGILAGSQHNTLDADWFGPVVWLSGLYLAALRAGEEMARELGDAPFASQCRAIFNTGTKKIVADLFDGDYFINKPDPAHLDAINSGTGCEIDQVFGQSWAFQVNLGRILPQKETLAALKSLWRYNFSPDVGPYREANKPGRWYAMPGEAGLLMCTFPRTDWDFARASGGGKGHAGFAGYFNECMNGFEHQVAGHMIWEGMVLEGLAILRAVHDRYHASRRNPWNEVECGDHYARSMATHGVFLAACGYEYHGPAGRLAFSPRLTPENFKCAFTAAEGWGAFSQRLDANKQTAAIDMKFGRLKVKEFALSALKSPTQCTLHLAGQSIPADLEIKDTRATIRLRDDLTIPAGQQLTIVLT